MFANNAQSIVDTSSCMKYGRPLACTVALGQGQSQMGVICKNSDAQVIPCKDVALCQVVGKCPDTNCCKTVSPAKPNEKLK